MSDITPPEYRALTDRLFAFYADERYDDALRLVDAESAQYPDRLSDLAHMAACLLAVSGRPGDALDRLLQADRPIPDDFPVRLRQALADVVPSSA